MNPIHNSAIFIVFEGLDGAGKTTCAKALAQALGARYMTTPTPTLREIQDDILFGLGDSQEARQLFYLATVFAAAKQVAASLAAGDSVVMDRYFLSTQVYAQARGSQLDLDTLCSQLLPATFTIFLDAELQVRHARLQGRMCTVSDRETLKTGMDARLGELYRQKSALSVAGTFLRFSNSSGNIDEIVKQMLCEIDRHPTRSSLSSNGEGRAKR